jgi:hypothetical protein
MRTARRALTAGVALLLLVQGPARAGGSWFDLDWDRVYVPGEAVTTTAQFSNGQQAPVSAGPWTAYLRPEDEASGVDEIELGPVAIEEGACCPWVATLTFTVPDVPTGTYWIDVRNAAGEGVGDLIGAQITIAPSAELFALTVVRDELRERVDRLRGRLDSLRESGTERYEAAVVARIGAELELERTEAELSRLRSELAAALRAGPPPRPLVDPIVGAALAVAILAFALVLERRNVRLRALRVPDTPADSLTRIRCQAPPRAVLTARLAASTMSPGEGRLGTALRARETCPTRTW